MSIDPETTLEKILRSGIALMMMCVSIPFLILWAAICAVVKLLKRKGG